MNQFTNLSSWREDNIIVKSGECYQLSFIDTKPNMFYVQNPNNCKLKISISKIPTKTNYEFLVNPNTSEPMGRPMPTGNLYILNTGTVDANLKIYSIADKFDMNILKNFTVQLDGVTVESSEQISFKEGVSLPSGNNNIGIVSPDSETSGNIETIVEKVSETNSTVSANMLSIKNSAVRCADNSRDILWQLDGRESADGTRRRLVKEIADGIQKINNDGIGAQINGNVYIDKDMFWKKEQKEISKTVSKDLLRNEEILIATGKIKTDFKEWLCSIKSTWYFKGKYSSDSTTLYYVTVEFSDITDTNATITVKICEDSSYRIVRQTGTKTIPISNNYADFYDVASFVAFPTSWRATSLQTDKKYTLKKSTAFINNEISGILYAMNRITEYTHSANYEINANSNITISDEFSTVGQKMWDKITMISSESDELKIKIYFTPNNYVQFKNAKSQPIRDLDIPVYAIELINDTSSVINVAMIGGKF